LLDEVSRCVEPQLVEQRNSECFGAPSLLSSGSDVCSISRVCGWKLRITSAAEKPSKRGMLMSSNTVSG